MMSVMNTKLHKLTTCISSYMKLFKIYDYFLVLLTMTNNYVLLFFSFVN